MQSLSGASAGSFSVPAELAAALSGESAVSIDFTGISGDMPLSWFHYARAAFGGKTVGFANTGGVVPVFKGSDWLVWPNANPDSLYAAYNNNDVIVEGITVKTDTHDSKKIIEYTRPIKIDDAEYYIDPAIDFSGFGIRQGAGGSISPVTGKTWDQVVIDSPLGISGKGYVANWTDYLTALKEAGLSCLQNPDGTARDLSAPGTPYPKHNVDVRASGSDNIMANGVYDFILAHYNPSQTGGGVDAALKACIDSMGFGSQGVNHFTFNGIVEPLPNLPPRVVNLGSSVTLNSDSRKAVNGAINNVFYGAMSTTMARYLQTKLGLQEFKNANIYGDYNQWNGQNITAYPGTPNFTNVALVGNYSGITISTVIKGVLDIQGSLADSAVINANSTKTGYLRLTGNVGNSNNRYSKFSVVDVTGLNNNINTVGSNNNSTDLSADVIIFATKSQATSIGVGAYNTPTYRAFENSGGTERKYAPYNGSLDSKWRSPTSPYLGLGTVPALSEAAWETAADGSAPAINATGNTWDVTDFSNGNIALAPFPGGSGVRLAGSMPVWPAVLPSAGTGSRKRGYSAGDAG